MRSDLDAWRESAALLTWGFRNAGSANPVGTLDAVPAADAAGVEAVGPRDGSTQETLAGAGKESGGLPWWAETLVVLLGVVVLLRARVLVLRRVRRSRALGGWDRPQRRDRRREATAATAAPSPAPSATPRQRPRRDGDDDDREASPAPTGTAS